MIKTGIIALDMDGTLLDSQKRLSERNRRTLEACARMGIQIVPATGRAPDGIVPEVRNLPGVRYAITANGAAVADLEKGVTLTHNPLPLKTALALVHIAKKYRVIYDAFIDGRGAMQKEFIENMDDYGVSPQMQQVVRMTRNVVPDTEKYMLECGKPIEKINVFMADPSDREAIEGEMSALGGVAISSSLYNNIEINAEAATKGNALLWLADHLGIDHSATMAFGDGRNDISMIAAAGIGVAMANGEEDVKAVADKVTLTNDQDGVAAALEELLLNC